FARIVKLDVEAARTAAGVVAVLTAADMQAAGVGNVSRPAGMKARRGGKFVVPVRPALAGERVMHIGEAVALVVAESRLAAADAAELVAVDYEELDPAVDLATAMEPGAPQLWSEAPGNVCIEWIMPDDEDKLTEVEQIVKAAPKVARVKAVHQRLIVASMETRGATASYDATTDRYTLRGSTQGPNLLADQIAPILNIKREQLRVFAEDVGGAFGMKAPVYPEYIALLVAARRTGRPVHWMSTRSESFVSDNQARDTITEAELALDEHGKFLALRIRHFGAMGGYVTANGAFIQANNFARCFPGMYDIPKLGIEVTCLFTNTVPTGPYRGAGRPEANYVIERVVDEAARVTGIDRAELRRRNLIPPSAIPYQTAVGTTYDSGDFGPVLEKALKLAQYGTFEQRRAEAARRGKRRGLGISCFLEHSGGIPTEGAAVTFNGTEPLTLGLGLHSTGQGHATVFSRLAAERLQVDPKLVRVKQGDTALGVAGLASVASRGGMTVSHAVVNTVDRVLEKGKKAASALLEAAETDIAYRNGHFEVVGTDRKLSLFEVAERAKELAKNGAIAEPLDTNAKVDTPQTFPNGCHVAEVEIDSDSGLVTVVGYAAVDDCGYVLDHTIVEGQVQGGLAQGLGQVLLENAVYDAGSGQLVAGSFMDYAMPRAEHMPPIKDGLHNVPATTNPLGVKGVGEGGTIGSLAALMNAIADAIPNGQGAALDMPATPEKIWRACQSQQLLSDASSA
ncbi:MAG TPA: xanthine dehydrogenase family protein molybdopterin-binding subunit, partial [Xanthobacteraceae bacterium]|nr:xanthine dehydrogenase family protein molybdopterin-binding subunit [Xanthobacteraceae bacterium]